MTASPEVQAEAMRIVEQIRRINRQRVKNAFKPAITKEMAISKIARDAALNDELTQHMKRLVELGAVSDGTA